MGWCWEGIGNGGETVPAHSPSLQAGKSSHRMSVQPVRMPSFPKEMTIFSQEHGGRSLSQNIFLFRKLTSRWQSKAECLFGNKKMRCGLKSVPACRHRSRKLEGKPEAVVCSQIQCWMGWRPRQLLFAACVLGYSLWICKVLIIFLLQHRGIS